MILKLEHVYDQSRINGTKQKRLNKQEFIWQREPIKTMVDQIVQALRNVTEPEKNKN